MMTLNPESRISIQAADWETDQHQLIAVRTQVFVDEQKVPPELEIDGHDPDCEHVKAVNQHNKVVATARLLPSCYIGRMCVLPACRGRGIGGQMLGYFIALARQRGNSELMLNAQLDAIPFYQKFGFVKDSAVFIEADIEHVHMTLSLAE